MSREKESQAFVGALNSFYDTVGAEVYSEIITAADFSHIRASLSPETQTLLRREASVGWDFIRGLGLTEDLFALTKMDNYMAMEEPDAHAAAHDLFHRQRKLEVQAIARYFADNGQPIPNGVHTYLQTYFPNWETPSTP
jgi:hypothetical protein